MPSRAECLQGAADALQRQLDNLQGGRLNAPASHMCYSEQGILEVLKAAEQADPQNGTIARARECMEVLANAPANVVRCAANGTHQYQGAFAAYITDLRMVLGYVQAAQQQAPASVSAAAPVNRAAWSVADWQRNDSAGLQAMMQTNTPEWQQLYKRETGTDYSPSLPHNKPR